MKQTSKNYSIEVLPLKANTYFLGEFIDSDTCYYIAKDNIKNEIVESFKNDLTTELTDKILRVSKNTRIEQIQVDDDKNLQTCFEFPTDSGKTFSISRSQFSYYNSMYIFKDVFVYPFEFLGNDGSSIIFNNSVDLENFVFSALSKHQEVYKNRYIIAVNSVNDVQVGQDIDNAINQIFSINY